MQAAQMPAPGTAPLTKAKKGENKEEGTYIGSSLQLDHKSEEKEP